MAKKKKDKAVTKSNCFFVALWLWFTRGGYLILRKAHTGPYPHFLWAKELPEGMKVIHYTTTEPEKSMRSVVFKGKLRRRESSDNPRMMD